MMDTKDLPTDEAVIEVSLVQDQALDILCNVRRRHAIRLLLANEQMSLTDLVDRVAAAEKNEDVAEISRNERKSVYASLHQYHLPRLEDAGWVIFDRSKGTVKLADECRLFQPHSALASATDASGACGDQGDSRNGSPSPEESDTVSDDEPASNSPDADEVSGDRLRTRETDGSYQAWVPYYASLCCGCWILAVADILDLVAYELITTSQWIFVFLLAFSLLILLHFQNDKASRNGTAPT